MEKTEKEMLKIYVLEEHWLGRDVQKIILNMNLQNMFCKYVPNKYSSGV